MYFFNCATVAMFVSSKGVNTKNLIKFNDMKKLISVLLLVALLGCLDVNKAQAQYVTIPDTGFVSWLTTNYPSCISGSQLDTTCPAVLNARVLNFPVNHRIWSLNGLQYFKNADSVTIPNITLDSLFIPPSLKYLVCINNWYVNRLPPLPNTMTYLDCSGGHIMYIGRLPDSLKYLDCSGDVFTAFTAPLPSGLQTLNCSSGNLDSLGSLPAGLKSLSCNYGGSGSRLRVVSSLPPALVYLSVNNSWFLTGLPSLPSTLQYLDCSWDYNFANLPALPASLQTLNCGFNGALSTLPALPTGLTSLYANYMDGLRSMPDLPDSMYTLDLSSDTVLYCLPVLHRIVNFSFTTIGGGQLGNQRVIRCVPNYGNVTNSNPLLDTMPLCQTGNGHGCLVLNGGLGISAGPDTTICGSYWYPLGGSPTATGGTPPYSYAWSPTTNLNSSIISNPWVIGTTGFTTYTVTVTDAAHNTATSSVNVNATVMPTSTFTITSPVDTGQQSTFTYTGSASAGAIYTWSFGGGNGSPGTGQGPEHVSWATPGIKLVALQVTDGECISTLAIDTVLVTTVPEYNLVYDSTLVNHAWFYCVNSGGVIDTGRLLVIQQPVNGTITKVTVGNNVCLTYTPAYNFIGYDTFRIQQCSDTSSTCDTTIVIMHVYSACYLCVWPGDANYDGIVNNADLLSIGIGYGTTGPVRPNATINWVGQPAPYWTDSLLDSTNYKYIDCNGDGIINAGDTVAIVLNYSSTHSRGGGVQAGGPGAPTFLPVVAEDTTYNGDTLTVQLVLGDSAQPANNVYGLAFTLNYDITAIDSTKAATVTFGNSWLGTAADKISIAKDFKQQGQLQCAVTRIDHTTRSGEGAIGTISVIVTTDNINGKNYVYYLENFFISNVTMVDSIGDILPVNSGSGSALVGYFPTGIAQVNSISNLVHIYPNPASNQLQIISSAGAISEIKITDVTGREVLNRGYSSDAIVTKQLLDISALNPGIYLVEVLTANGVAVQKLIVAR